MSDPVYSNTFRLTLNKDIIILEYGYNDLESEDEIATVTEDEMKSTTKIAIPPTMYSKLVMYLLEGGLEYEKRYKKEIGFANQ